MFKETYRDKRIINDLLWEMENYDWALVSEARVNGVEIGTDQGVLGGTRDCSGMKLVGHSIRFNARQIIRHSGLNLDGSILEFDAGSTSIGAEYPDFIAIDQDPNNVKHLRRQGIKAIIGTIEDLPFPKHSFDYVLAFSPSIVRKTRGWRWTEEETGQVEVTSEYKQEIVNRAIELAEKKVLIASIPIALDPPCVDRLERKITDPRRHYYYVIYKAG